MNFKVVFRSLKRSGLNSTVITLSLAVGLACLILIVTFIVRELNTDDFHRYKKHIYALQADDPWDPKSKMYYIRAGAAEYMKTNYAEVIDFCRISNVSPQKVVVKNTSFFDDKKTIAASSNFFEFFSFPLKWGDPEHVLQTKQDVVISERLADRFFGTSNPVGQVITFGTTRDLIVTGVFTKTPQNSQIVFDMVRMETDWDSRCYIRLADNTDVKKLETKLQADKSEIPVIHDGTPGAYSLKGLKKTYFDTSRRQPIEASRDIEDLKIAAIIGLLIFGVGVFNYLGLVNNRIIEKVEEYSIRRINGSSKTDLIGYFFTENLLLIFAALVLSLPLIAVALPFFNSLVGTSLRLNSVLHLEVIVAVFSILTVIFLSTLFFVNGKISQVFRTSTLQQSTSGFKSRKTFPAFNISQLAISIALIAVSLVISQQISYIVNKDIGINRQALEVKIPPDYGNKTGVFKEELKRQASVAVVSRTQASPVLEHFVLLLHYQDEGQEKQYTPAGFIGDQNYISVLDIELTGGRDFSSNPEANINTCIINESLASLFPDRDLINTKLPGNEEMTIIGIAKDFHYGSLKHFVEPAYIAYGNEGTHLMVMPNQGQTNEAREAITMAWKKLIPDFPVRIESVGERYAWMHRENRNYAKLIGACSLISVFLCMIGLFVVSFQASRRRTKEVGIRKVNGARIIEILSLLNKRFIAWVGIAFIIATPVAWYAMNQWLKNFAYKTDLNWWIFALAGLLALGIALLTVSWQSWKAATRNPVEALRYE